MVTKIKIVAFGHIANIMQTHEFILSDVKNTDELIKQLNKRFPALASIKYSIALNKKIIRENTLLVQEDTIALLPPFSGG